MSNRMTVVRRGRASWRTLIVAMAALATLAIWAPAASAYEQITPVESISPAGQQYTRGLHSWYYVSTGASPAGYVVCAYMWNDHNQVVRGGTAGVNCWRTTAAIQFNRTSDPWYNARGQNQSTVWLGMVTHAIA